MDGWYGGIDVRYGLHYSAIAEASWYQGMKRWANFGMQGYRARSSEHAYTLQSKPGFAVKPRFAHKAYAEVIALGSSLVALCS